MPKWTRYLCSIALMFIVSMMASGQGAPEQIQDALAKFNQDNGLNITLNDLYWSWEQLTASDSSLGCPKDGEVYTQAQVVTYRFLFTYNGSIYDYRVSADRTNVRFCGATSTDAPTSTPSADSTPDPRSNRLCPTPPVGISYIRSRLVPGLQGIVPQGNASRIRADPATTAAQLGEIGAGTVFEVISGPTCDPEGYVWWQVLVGSLSGWLAEGRDGEYFVEPLTPGTVLAGSPVITKDNLPLVAEVDKIQGNFTGDVAFSLDSKLVALGNTGAEGAWVYDNLNETPRILPSTLPLTTIAFGSPGSDKFLALFGGEDGGIRLWDLTIDDPVVERVFLLGHDDPVTAVAFKADGTQMASSGGLAYTTQNDLATDTNAILLWDVQNVTLKLALRGHLADVTGLVYLPDGSLVSSSLDGSVRWWDTTTGAQRAMIQAENTATSLALSPDGTLIVAGYADGSITAYRPEANLTLTSGVPVFGHAGGVTDLTFNPDGSLLATSGVDGKIIIWDATQLMTADNQNVVKTTLPGGHSGAADGVTFSPDGTLLASIGVDRFIRLWTVSGTAG